MKAAVSGGLLPQKDQPTTPDALLRLSEWEYLLSPCIKAAYPDWLPNHAHLTWPESAIASRESRLRWFWAIRRIISQSRASKAKDVILTDSTAQNPSDPPQTRWWGTQTQTSWSVTDVSQEDTAALVILSKQKGVRIGALLYASLPARSTPCIKTRFSGSVQGAEAQ